MRSLLAPLLLAGCLNAPGFTEQHANDVNVDVESRDSGDAEPIRDAVTDNGASDSNADIERDSADTDVPDLSNEPLFEAFPTEGYSFTTSGQTPIRFARPFDEDRDTVFFSKRIGATGSDVNHWTLAFVKDNGTLNFIRTAAGSEVLAASQQVRWRADSTITYSEVTLTDGPPAPVVLNEQTFVLFQTTNNSSVVGSAFIAMNPDGSFQRRETAPNTYLSYQTVESPEFRVRRSDFKIQAGTATFSETCSCERSNALLLYSYTVEGTSYPMSSTYATCGINAQNEIVCERGGAHTSTIELRFQIVSFQNDAASVVHERLTLNPAVTRVDTQGRADVWMSGLQGPSSLGTCAAANPMGGDRAKSCNFRIGKEQDRSAKVERLQPSGTSTIWVQGLTAN